jgi:hypothetical protein
VTDALDLDKGHPKANVWWVENRHRLPETHTHRTRSGGLHLLFRHTPRLRGTAGRIAPDIDRRGDGGYLIRRRGSPSALRSATCQSRPRAGSPVGQTEDPRRGEQAAWRRRSGDRTAATSAGALRRSEELALGSAQR